MTPAELAKKIGRTSKWVQRHQHELKFLELTKRVGHDRYSAVLVEKFLSGDRVVNFGAGRLTDRRIA